MQQIARAPDYRPTRLSTLQQELRHLQEKRQLVESDPSLDGNRRAIEVGYYDWIIRLPMAGSLAHDGMRTHRI